MTETHLPSEPVPATEPSGTELPVYPDLSDLGYRVGCWALVGAAAVFTALMLALALASGAAGYTPAVILGALVLLGAAWCTRARVHADPSEATLIVRNPTRRVAIAWDRVEAVTFEPFFGVHRIAFTGPASYKRYGIFVIHGGGRKLRLVALGSARVERRRDRAPDGSGDSMLEDSARELQRRIDTAHGRHDSRDHAR